MRRELRQGGATGGSVAPPATPPRSARALRRQAEQPEGGAEQRLQEPPQCRPREERAADVRVVQGADAEPEDEEDGEDGDADRAVRLTHAMLVVASPYTRMQQFMASRAGAAMDLAVAGA